MDRRDVLKRILYPKCKSAIEFKFDTLMANPLLSYITVQDIAQLNKIATSLKYSSKPKEKYKMIDNILVPRGFKKMASGTNRVAYRFLNDYRVVLKVAIDKVGLSDNGNEYRNQFLLKPFVTKCFEVSPCGTVGLFERVVPITSREEFINISEDVFDLINNLIGKYVLEDIGEKYYMNYGLREGFGPVLLDYPYVFELDGRKLICNVPEPLDPKGYCRGEIDYDLGYNNLICTKCGKRYLARDLKSEEKSDKPKIIIKGEDMVMKMVLKRGNEVVSKLNSETPVAVNNIPSKKQYNNLRGNVKRGNNKENKKNNNYKHNIKSSDDVTFKARIKGNPKERNYDKNARRKEENLERNTPKIKVSFEENNNTKPVEEKTNFKAELFPVENENTEYIGECFRAVIKGTEIWNVDTNKIIGYINSDSNPNELTDKENYNNKEESSKEVINDDNIEEETSNNSQDVETTVNDEIPKSYYDEEKYEPLTQNLGETLKNSEAYKGNENYKTGNIVSQIENHYSSSEIKEEANDEKKEIPELVFHKRQESEDEDKVINEY